MPCLVTSLIKGNHYIYNHYNCPSSSNPNFFPFTSKAIKIKQKELKRTCLSMPITRNVNSPTLYNSHRTYWQIRLKWDIEALTKWTALVVATFKNETGTSLLSKFFTTLRSKWTYSTRNLVRPFYIISKMCVW